MAGAKKDLRTLFSRFLFVTCYCLIGAGIFYAIEHTDHYEEEEKRKKRLYNQTKIMLIQKLGINESEFESLVTKIIDANSSTPLKWTFTRGIDLCWQTMTTIGYGNKPPTTLAGQLFLIPFAIFGIPLTVFMLNTMGENICHFVGFINRNIESICLGSKKESHCKVKSLFTVSLLTIALLLMMAGVSVKAEGWSFGLGLYVWFVTFSTVGFGDYIPGHSEEASRDGHVAIIVYRLICVMIGLSLISTIFNAITDCIEEKRKKAESTSWIGFLVSAFTANSASSHGNEVHEMDASNNANVNMEKQSTI